MDHSGRHQHRQHRRACHLHVLGDEENLASLGAVGHGAANQGEKEDRNAAEKLIQSE